MGLGKTAQAIACELRLEPLLECVVENILSTTGARTAAALLIEPGQGDLVVRARRGRGRQFGIGERRALGQGVAGWVAQRRVPLVIGAADERADYRAIARADGYEGGSLLGVPIQFQENLVGVACAAEKAGDAEDDSEEDLPF